MKFSDRQRLEKCVESIVNKSVSSGAKMSVGLVSSMTSEVQSLMEYVLRKELEVKPETHMQSGIESWDIG